MPIHQIRDTILKSWEDFLQKENFNIVENRTTKYICYFENESIELKINVERYFQRFDIQFIRKGDFYGRNIFSLLEYFQGENSKIYPMLYPMSSHYNFRKNFGKRFFSNNPINDINDFKKTIYFFGQIIQEELPQILKGDFNFLEDYKKHFRKSLNHYKSVSEKEKQLLEKDNQFIHKHSTTYPEQKIIDEISSQIKKGRRINEYSKYELNPNEKEWIYSLKYPYQNGNLRLSKEYLEAFEKVHKIILPREYKLFLNWVGNGNDKLFKLEQSLTYSEGPSSGFGHFEFIDLEKPFESRSNFSNFNGMIRLHNYGCGIQHYLIVNGKHHGKIWIDDHHVESNEIYLFRDKEGNPKGFKTWYEKFKIGN